MIRAVQSEACQGMEKLNNDLTELKNNMTSMMSMMAEMLDEQKKPNRLARQHIQTQKSQNKRHASSHAVETEGNDTTRSEGSSEDQENVDEDQDMTDGQDEIEHGAGMQELEDEMEEFGRHNPADVHQNVRGENAACDNREDCDGLIIHRQDCQIQDVQHKPCEGVPITTQYEEEDALSAVADLDVPQSCTVQPVSLPEQVRYFFLEVQPSPRLQKFC